jgi:hypothetical protein
MTELTTRTWRAGVFGLWIVLTLAVAPACVKARAASAPDGPPLEMPEPPPRVLGPLEDDVPATTAVTEPPVAAPRAVAPRPPARRPNGTAAEAERQEPPAATPAPPAAAVTTSPDPAPAEGRELLAAPTATVAVAERKIRDLLTRASRDLNRVDYGRLSVDGRSQYEQSKRFSQQAEQALKDRNVNFATTLADKAATLAAELLASR